MGLKFGKSLNKKWLAKNFVNISGLVLRLELGLELELGVGLDSTIKVMVLTQKIMICRNIYRQSMLYDNLLYYHYTPVGITATQQFVCVSRSSC